MPFKEHAGHRYAVQFTYAVPDAAWIVELSETVSAPAAWADIPGAETHLPGNAFLTAIVPDEDPQREPTIIITSNDEHTIPYEIMRWFMENVADEVARCRTATAENVSEEDS